MTRESEKNEKKKSKLSENEKQNLQAKLNQYDENVVIGAHIVIQDSNMLEEGEIADVQTGIRKAKPEKVINYETFESSSEDEFSQGAFESAAHSFQNKEKHPEQDVAELQDHKRIERQRRRERKHTECLKKRAENDRQKRKNIRKKFRLQSLGVEHYDEYQEDMLNFKDSDRESVISYFEGDLGKQTPQLEYRLNNLDTPKRLVNYSNEFLGQKKKIDNEKLKNKNLVNRPIKNFNDLDNLSGIEKSDKSTFRKQEDYKQEMLFQIVTHKDIEQLQLDI